MSIKLMPTRGETLVMWRRRENLNQLQAARKLDVSPTKYREWEADKNKEGQPRQVLGPLMPHEKCYLLRRRQGKKQRDIAQEIGVTRLWVIKMEEGRVNSDRLCKYWKV